ncbi:MAG TPA: DUF2007 domain-containing protein [Candidatus Hydrogenedentes bacterium]|nr:DUF2007 domain-containing protein [Candidatus Hydrogenedentota bacterium]
MFCPNCRIEYEEGLDRCGECDAALVAELPPEDEPEYVEWVTVLTTNREDEAMVAESVLGAAGIECNVQGRTLRVLVPMPAGPIQIEVRAEDAEAALELLSEHFEMDAESEDAEEAAREPESSGTAREVMADEYAADAGLADEPEGEREYVECVTVLSARNEEEIMVVQSLLGSAGIPCYAKGQLIQDLFAWGRLGAGYSLATGPVEIQVQAEHAEAARRILAEQIKEGSTAEE